ncbi:bifunctional diaminohydroxyphosphoribosylaminopyrimidine deaminase/5-amino-6-(5-phosphoribosylamino)uracil reductase RibD [Alkalicoccobacillus gibsonii]|uniref:bifunctional diaminohydroxyphosphoribosylaminopyrimidine deaminase/5-amino-6-(5-phosphoribosylamino)uracil reductase RibD n=1 Tax=Alkalicoccobacillus gibsonii TaxID=79881 RepID=UPI003F7C9C5A
MDHEFMKLALTLAQSAKGQTSPNPMVGAVVVKDGRIVGTGAHLKAGEAHAEVHALNMAQEKAKGATIYVTLEPCSHYGRTPPCAKRIIESGIKRVVVACVDSNPEVGGKGVKMLEEAGIEVEVGVCEKEALDLNRAFFHFIETHRPYVTLKSASTLDGKTATVSGESKWITGAEARMDGHRLRHENDAILVGVGTVLADNPSLTTRLEGSASRHPIRVVLDSKLRTPFDAQIVMDQLAQTLIFTLNTASEEKERQLTSQGAQVIRLDSLTIGNVLFELGKRDIQTILVEGGSEVHGSFIKEGFVNEVVQYLAPKLVGGKHASPVVGGEGIKNLKEAVQLQVQSVTHLGEDIKILSRVRRE